MIAQHATVLPNTVQKAMKGYLSSGGWLTEHKQTEIFEQQVCQYIKVKHCHAVTSGTIGLYLALKACGVMRKDEVIVPDISMIATVNAVLMCGAVPVFADIDLNGCLEIDEIRFTDRTKAVIYVSLNGRADRMQELKERCTCEAVYLIEDACQSFGSKHDGRCLGTFGDIGVFSLSSHKLIATGQGGLVVTDSDIMAEEIARLKDHGRLSGGGDIHEHFGINAKYTDIQAVIGQCMLEDIDNRIRAKRRVYDRYYDNFFCDHSLHMIQPNKEHIPWMVDAYVEDREGLQEHLKKFGIQTRTMYPQMSKQKYINKNLKLLLAENLAKHGIWLPSSIDLSNDDIDIICGRIQDYYA